MSGSIHQQVQCGDEVVEAGVAEIVPQDDQLRSPVRVRETQCNTLQSPLLLLQMLLFPDFPLKVGKS